MEDSEQRKKRLKEMRVQADQSEVSGGVENSVMPDFLSNPLIEVPTMPSRDKSYAAARFDFYTDPMSAFSSNKRNYGSNQAAPNNFPPNFGGSPMAQYSSPHPESTNPQMAPPPVQVSSAAYRNPVWSGPRGPVYQNFPFHPSSGPYPRPRFEPSGGPLYNSAQGMAHWPSYSPTPSSGYRNSPRSSYSPNPSPRYSYSPRPSYSPTPSSGYRNNPGPGQWPGKDFKHNTGSPVSGRLSGQGPNFQGHQSNENTARGPDPFYKRSMVEDPWKHLDPIIWNSLNNSHIPENLRPLFSKSKSKDREGSSAASVKSSSEPSLAEYLAAAFNEAANDAENI